VSVDIPRFPERPGVDYYALPFQAPKEQNGPDAVEVAYKDTWMGEVFIRGTFKLNRAVVVTQEAWQDFIAAVKRGEYDSI